MIHIYMDFVSHTDSRFFFLQQAHVLSSSFQGQGHSKPVTNPVLSPGQYC